MAMNFSPEQIAAITQLPLAEIEILKEEICDMLEINIERLPSY